MKTARSYKVHTVCAALTAMSMGWPLGASANDLQKTECSVSQNKAEMAPKSTNVIAAIVKVYSARCSTYENMKRRLSASGSDAGRKLEPTKPLDVNAAQAQLRTARGKPDFQAALASELEGVTDETTRALLEIALLDDMEYDKARDLLLLDLRKSGAK